MDLTRSMLADRVYCSVSMVRRMEAGEVRPSRSLAESLATALDIPPDEQGGFVRFARGESKLFGSSAGGTAQGTRISTNLPAPLTSFVGRKQEVTAGCELLRQEGVRLLTLTGPPGVGKTRLSITIANQLADIATFPDGVVFVSLAPIREPALVVSAVAQILGVREASQTTGEDHPLHHALKVFLHPKRLLLVLDNFEQVTTASPFVIDWLTAAPGLKLLITSRDILHAYGEYEFPVPPLNVPDINRLPSSQAHAFYTHYSAIQLFKERAKASKYDFRLTPDNMEDIARICAWLDGLPLAIEMAAAQVKWLPIDRLFEQLSHRLAALTGGPRDLSPRQQSLIGAIEWSYHLLSVPLQKLFDLLSIFVGGCDLEAVQEVVRKVTGEEGGVESIQSLVEKNLVLHEILPNGEIRFGMLETLRAYALERLQASEMIEPTRRAHADHYFRLAQTAEPHMIQGRDQTVWLKRLEQEHNNLRAAMTWALEQPDESIFALELARAMYHFWYIRGHLTEGRHWLEAALAMDNPPTELRGHVLNNVGSLSWLQGDYAGAQRFHDQALRIQEQLKDEPGLARSLESLAILAATPGDYARAKELLEQALTIRRRLNDLGKMLTTLNNLATVVVRLGQFGYAEQLYRESAELSRTMENVKALGHTLHGWGEVQMASGNYTAALASLHESLVIRQELGDRPGLAKTLETMGIVLYHLQNTLGAARLIGAGLKLREELGLAIYPAERREIEANIALVRDQVGESAFEQAWAEGEAMSQEEAVEFALGEELKKSEI